MNIDKRLLGTPKKETEKPGGSAPGFSNVGGRGLDNHGRNASAKRAGAMNQARHKARQDKIGNQTKNKAGANRASGNKKVPGQARQPQSLREAVLEDKKKRAQTEKKEGGAGSRIGKAAAAPISRGTSKLLRQAWLNLVDSWGLTLIWINIHVFLGSIFGNKFFCKLGDEWGQAGSSGFAAAAGGGKSQMKSAKMAETVEPMGLVCCDLGCLLIIIASCVPVAIIASFLDPSLETIKNLLGGLWNEIKGIF